LEIRGIPGDIVLEYAEYAAGTINWLSRVGWTASAASELSAKKNNSIIADAYRMSESPISVSFFLNGSGTHC
jgi:hypothetical protein